MIIKKLSIKEFGSLKNKEIYLGGGINLVEGDNESGKSTILAFIRFLLYGTPRRSASEVVSEKDRYVNWDSGVAEGSMEIATNKGSFRIERRLQKHAVGGRESYTETCAIFDLQSGAEVYRGEVPGKLFLGIPLEVYNSTSSVRQLDCTNVDGNGVGTSIENLLFSADETVDTDKIRAKLDDYRRTLLYKNEKGGKLFELETTKSLIETKLEIAKRDAEAVIAKEATVEKMKVLSEKTKTQIAEYEKQLELYETCTVLKRFETLHAYEKKHEEFLAKKNVLAAEKGFDGKLPNREVLAELDLLTRALADKMSAASTAKALLEGAKAAPDGDRALAAFDEIIVGEGDRDSLLARVRASLKKKKRNTLLGILCAAFGSISLAASLLMYFTELLSAYLSGIPYLDYGLFGGGLLLLVFCILAFGAVAKAKRSRLSILARIGVTDKKTSLTDLGKYMDTCRSARLACHAYDTRLAEATEAQRRTVDELSSAVASAQTFLSSVGASADTNESPALIEHMKATYNDLFATCTEKERLEGEIGGYERLITELRGELHEYNEAALSATLGGRAVSEVMDGMDITKIRMSYNFTRTQHAATEQKRIGLEKELIALTSTSESPARLSVKLDEVNKELEKTRAQYGAVKTAHEYLGLAAENLRKSVTPSLRVRASELMSKITGGKYSALGISNDMDITVTVDGTTRSIEALSKGTKDAAYIALRLALVELICAGDPPPVLFDESFTQLDEKRTEKMLNMLMNLGLDGKQTILFTCHKREGQMLKKMGTFHHIKLDPK